MEGLKSLTEPDGVKEYTIFLAGGACVYCEDIVELDEGSLGAINPAPILYGSTNYNTEEDRGILVLALDEVVGVFMRLKKGAVLKLPDSESPDPRDWKECREG